MTRTQTGYLSWICKKSMVLADDLKANAATSNFLRLGYGSEHIQVETSKMLAEYSVEIFPTIQDVLHTLSNLGARMYVRNSNGATEVLMNYVRTGFPNTPVSNFIVYTTSDIGHITRRDLFERR